MNYRGEFRIYTLRDAAGAPLYVGMTQHLRTRIAAHRRKPWAAEIASVESFGVWGYDVACRVEAQRIRVHQPRYNVTYTERNQFRIMRADFTVAEFAELRAAAERDGYAHMGRWARHILLDEPADDELAAAKRQR